jgi:hypothetical protein
MKVVLNMVKNSASKKSKIQSFPRDTLEQAMIVRTGWSKVGKKLSVPNLTMEKFLNKLDEAKDRVERAEQLKVERSKAIQERNRCFSELWDLTKRIRNAAKATFGDNSNELEFLIDRNIEKETKS